MYSKIRKILDKIKKKIYLETTVFNLQFDRLYNIIMYAQFCVKLNEIDLKQDENEIMKQIQLVCQYFDLKQVLKVRQKIMLQMVNSDNTIQQNTKNISDFFIRCIILLKAQKIELKDLNDIKGKIKTKFLQKMDKNSLVDYDLFILYLTEKLELICCKNIYQIFSKLNFGSNSHIEQIAQNFEKQLLSQTKLTQTQFLQLITLVYSHNLQRHLDKQKVWAKAIEIIDQRKIIYNLLKTNNEDLNQFYHLLNVEKDYKLMRKMYLEDSIKINNSQKRKLIDQLKKRYFRFVYKSSGFEKFELFIQDNTEDMIIALEALKDYVQFYNSQGNFERSQLIQDHLDSIVFRNKDKYQIFNRFQIPQFEKMNNPLLYTEQFISSSEILDLPYKGENGFLSLKKLGYQQHNITWVKYDNFSEKIQILSTQKLIALDTEFTNLPFNLEQKTKLCLVQVGFNKDIFLFDTLSISYEQFQQLILIINQKNIFILGFQLKYDLDILNEQSNQKLKMNNIIHAQDFSDENKNLRDFTFEFLQYDFCKFDQVSQWDNRPLSKQVMHYAAMDVAVLLKIKDIIVDKINNNLIIFVHQSLHNLKQILKILKINFRIYRRKKLNKRGQNNKKIIFLKQSILYDDKNLMNKIENLQNCDQLSVNMLLNFLIKL